MDAGAAVLAALHPIHPLGVPRPLFRGCWRAGGAMTDDGPWAPLGEAAQRFVDPKLLAVAEQAAERSRAAGGRPVVVGMLSFDGSDVLPSAERWRVEAYSRLLAARAAVARDFRRQLIAGELVARGRPDKLAAAHQTIPADIWPHLRISAWRGTVTGTDKVRWYMVEVARAADAGPVRPPPQQRKATEREIIDFMVKRKLDGSIKSMEVDRAAFLEAHPHLTAPVKFFQDVREPQSPSEKFCSVISGLPAGGRAVG